VPTFDRAYCLERAILSVLGQKKAPPFELIVVDDGSRDETPRIISSFGRRLKGIRKENEGVAAARNSGIRVSKGKYLAFLDSDDEWLDNKLEEQYRFMENRQNLLISQTDEIWMRRGERVNPGRRHQKREGDIFLNSISLCLISPSAVILRASLLDEIGLFDESLPVCEDYDMWLRVTLKYQVGLIRKHLVIKHGGRKDQLSARPGLDLYRVRSLQKLLKENPELEAQKAEAVKSEMERRLTIYQVGRQKREKTDKEQLI
jgi:glycosyltransferase involved in cell wall biosynthesis